MMKKFLAIAIALVMIFSLAACAGGDSGSSDDGIKLALVTDYGTIDDGSFNQGAWEGLVAYATEHDIRHQYVQPQDETTADYINAIELVIEEGAVLVVTPGFMFSNAIHEVQSLYPDVKFVLLDTVPESPDGNVHVAPNTVAVLYAEQEAGFLAGYAAVMDGYRDLGFIGGIPVPAVVLFGTGFVEGAEYAANELGLGAGDISLRYHYSMVFWPTPDVVAMAESWYDDGVEVIFAAAGGAGFSVMAAASDAGAKVIGVDIDQAGASPTVITSALKGLKASVYSIITDFYADKFPGGQQKMFNAASDGVGLPMSTSRFNNFTQAQYDAIFARLAAGEFKLSTTLGMDAHLGISTSIVNLINVS